MWFVAWVSLSQWGRTHCFHLLSCHCFNRKFISNWIPVSNDGWWIFINYSCLCLRSRLKSFCVRVLEILARITWRTKIHNVDKEKKLDLFSTMLCEIDGCLATLSASSVIQFSTKKKLAIKSTRSFRNGQINKWIKCTHNMQLFI